MSFKMTERDFEDTKRYSHITDKYQIVTTVCIHFLIWNGHHISLSLLSGNGESNC